MTVKVVSIRQCTLVALLLLPLTVAQSGCGGKQAYPVRGKVTYKDGSVPRGSVAVVLFTPSDDTTAEIRKGASGSIEPDGSFEMVTRMPGDGVYRGTYGVTFRVMRDTSNPASSYVAAKYTSPKSPQFTVNVDRNISDLSYVIEKAEGVAEAPANATAGPGVNP